MLNRPITRPIWLPVCVVFGLAASAAMADQPHQTIPDPGYRPDAYYDPQFVTNLETATVAVLPTIVRRSERSACSFDSQQQILESLGDLGIDAVRKPRRIDPGPIRRPSQWEIFQYGARSVSESLQGYDTVTDYTLVMEILVPDSQAVFGIEVYIVDAESKHMLSFLLNSHHEMFAEATLLASDSSEDARNRMIRKATKVGLAALDEQLELLREGHDPVGAT